MSIRQVITSYDDILTFGKFKGKSIDWVSDNEPSYIVWLAENGIIECDEDILNAAEWDDRENSPPEDFFFPDLGSK